MNNKGSILIVLLVIVLMIGFGSGLTLRSLQESRNTTRTTEEIKAFWLAEAGIQRAIWEHDSNNCASFINSLTNSACNDCACGNANKELTDTLIGTGQYSVVLNVNNNQITSIGTVTNAPGTSSYTRTLQASINPNENFLKYAIFTNNGIKIDHLARIDSYNSSNGDYGNQNRGTNGNLGNNASEGKQIHSVPVSAIYGNVSYVAPKHTQIYSRTFTGSQIAISPENLTPKPVPEELLALGELNNYIQLRGEQTITAGDYSYRYINIHNDGHLIIDGDVRLYLWSSSSVFSTGNGSRVTINPSSSLTIYAKGAFSINGFTYFQNLTKDPSKFILYQNVDHPSKRVQLGSVRAPLYGYIYAPKGNVTLDVGTIFHGAIVGYNTHVKALAHVRYDENLETTLQSNIAANSIINDWKDISGQQIQYEEEKPDSDPDPRRHKRHRWVDFLRSFWNWLSGARH